MEKIKVLRGTVVTLIQIPEYTPVLQRPKIAEYDNPYIQGMIPCEKRDGKYFDLRTGVEVMKNSNTLEWTNLTGTLFSYRDGQNVLLSRRFADNKIMLFSVKEQEINKQSMIVRRVRNKRTPVVEE